MANLEKIKSFVIEQFFSNLPEGLYYHNLEHTLDVFESVKRIGQAEQLTAKEIELAQIAALFHDTGFVDVYENNESLGAEYAVKYLPSFGFEASEIEQIKNAILATNLGIPPKSLFDKVLCDADLDYLGRPDFEYRSNLLYKELKYKGLITSKEQWLNLQLKFLSAPHYFTNYSLKNRAPQVKEILNKLKGA